MWFIVCLGMQKLRKKVIFVIFGCSQGPLLRSNWLYHTFDRSLDKLSQSELGKNEGLCSCLHSTVPARLKNRAWPGLHLHMAHLVLPHIILRPISQHQGREGLQKASQVLGQYNKSLPKWDSSLPSPHSSQKPRPPLMVPTCILCIYETVQN